MLSSGGGWPGGLGMTAGRIFGRFPALSPEFMTDQISAQNPVRSIEAPTIRSLLRAYPWLFLLASLGFGILFWPGLTDLWNLWLNNSDFSHGLLIVPISIAILYANRGRILELPVRISWFGLGVLLVSIGAYFLGRELLVQSLQRFGVLGAVVGSLLFVFGSPLIRRYPFPFFFLFLSVPPPLYNLGGFRQSLQEFVTRLSFKLLQLFGQPALAEDNLLIIGGIPLNVTDACSGIRSLMTMIATAVLFAYLMRAGVVKGALLTITAIPITIMTNVMRLLVMALALSWYDIDLTANAGWRHDLLGILSFTLGLAGLYLGWMFYQWFFRVEKS